MKANRQRPIRDDSGERDGWWIRTGSGERFVPDDGSDLARRDAALAALREIVSLQGSALREIRIRLHAAGRRPEECYEMSILDDTIAAVRRALKEKP